MINILDMDEVARIINEVTSAKNLTRKRNEYINYEVESGLLRKYVAAKVKALYPVTHADYTISEYSLLKKVVDKKARAYKETPVRKLDSDSESVQYGDFLKKNRFNDAMKDMDRIYNQHKYGGMYVESDEEAGTVCFYPLRPYEFDVVKNDKGEVICLILSYPGTQVTSGEVNKIIAGDRADDNGGEVEYVLWTRDHHLVVSVSEKDKVSGQRNITVLENEGNPSNVNPYGVIPFAYLPYDFNEDYPSPSPLTNQTIEINGLLSVYLTSANMQVGQLVIKGPKEFLPAQVASGMMSSIILPQSPLPEDRPTEAAYIAPSPNMQGHKDAIMTYLTMVLDEQGINSAQGIDGIEKFSSGLDRLLSQADIQSIIEDNQDFYTRFEQHVFEIVNAIIGSEFKSKFLQITFKKPKILSSDTEKLANLKTMLELGLIEEWEKFITVDPNMTNEQAKEKLTRIKAEKQAPIDPVQSEAVV